MSAPTTTATEPTATPTPQSPTVTPPEPTVSGEDKRFTQADVDRIVKERLDRDREKAERERKDAERKAAEERLRAQQEFETLANQRADEIAELRPQAEQAERYKAALQTYLDKHREGLPEHITKLLDRLDPVDQLEWIATNQEQLQPASNGSRGIPPTPRPAPSASREELIANEVNARRSGRARIY